MSAVKGNIGTSGFATLHEPAVWGDSENDIGVLGTSDGSQGVQGVSEADAGVWGSGDALAGVCGFCKADGGEGFGVAGYLGTEVVEPLMLLDAANGPCGVYGLSDDYDGVVGASNGDGYGVLGLGTFGGGVAGMCPLEQPDGVGVFGSSAGKYSVVGVVAPNTNLPEQVAALFSNFLIGPGGRPLHPQISYQQAAEFAGHVQVSGNLFVAGVKGFQIDHPLDPKNKTLKHSAVESPDMKTFYDGIATLDKSGRVTVTLPKWFSALNKDFRYQLTPIGAASPDLHVSQEIENNRFKIAGGAPKGRVCWQITGARQDAWANAYRMQVEERKSAKEKGRYVAPHLYPETQGKDLRSVLRSTLADALSLQERTAKRAAKHKKAVNGSQKKRSAHGKKAR